jgi:hypothetical protein
MIEILSMEMVATLNVRLKMDIFVRVHQVAASCADSVVPDALVIPKIALHAFTDSTHS